MHTRATGKVANHASNEGQNGEAQHALPEQRIQRNPVGQLLEHEQQTPFHGPQRQPEEDLHGKELLEHRHEVGRQARVRRHPAGRDGLDVVEGRHRGEVQRDHDGEGAQRHVHEQVLERQRDPARLEPARAAAHEHEDGGDAEAREQHPLRCRIRARPRGGRGALAVFVLWEMSWDTMLSPLDGG